MMDATGSPRQVVPQWTLNLGLALTLASYGFIGTTVIGLFRSMYEALGSLLPLPTAWVLAPGRVLALAFGFLVASGAVNIGLHRRRHLLVPCLAAVLALSASLISFLMFALVLPLMKLPAPPPGP